MRFGNRHGGRRRLSTREPSRRAACAARVLCGLWIGDETLVAVVRDIDPRIADIRSHRRLRPTVAGYDIRADDCFYIDCSRRHVVARTVRYRATPAVPEGWQPRRPCHSVDVARLEGGRSPGMAGVRRRDGDVPPRGRHRRQRRGTRCGRGPRHVHNVGLTTRAAGRSARGHVRLESRHVRRRHRRPAAKIRPTRSGPSGSEAGFLSRPGHMPIRLVRCRLPADLGGQLAAGHCGELCGLARLADPGGRRRVDPRPRRSGSDPGRDQWQDRPP